MLPPNTRRCGTERGLSVSDSCTQQDYSAAINGSRSPRSAIVGSSADGSSSEGVKNVGNGRIE